MTFKELEREIKAWGERSGKDIVIFNEGKFTVICERKYSRAKVLATIKNAESVITVYECGDDAVVGLFKALIDFELTKQEEDQKRYIIPLPYLKTTDGEQQYLSHKGNFFASRRDKKIRQTWQEKDLLFVPEIYRKYAVELEEEDDF